MANRNKVNSKYSYGWQRAEILAASVNGIFLLALCFSIFLEAVQRLVSIQSSSLKDYLYSRSILTSWFFLEIRDPKLVVIVGAFGLASNILGLFLFHGSYFPCFLVALLTQDVHCV
jgi:solute carrier family 30 (zinc transporter), member 1